MKRTTLVTVPATVDGRPFSVTYRVTVVVDGGGSPAAHGAGAAALAGTPLARGARRNGLDLAVGGRFHTAWGYAEAVPVQLSAERQFDLAIDHSGETSHTGDGWA